MVRRRLEVLGWVPKSEKGTTDENSELLWETRLFGTLRCAAGAVIMKSSNSAPFHTGRELFLRNNA
jgi:hypothetical protein